MGHVYIAVCQINGKGYIGKTIGSMAKRAESHRKDSISGSKFAFHRAIRKYGYAQFEWKVIAEAATHDDLCRLEIEFIAKMGTKVPSGYNLTDGGDGFKGHKKSKEHKRKIGLASKGRKLSEESRKKISEARKKTGSPWAKGKKLSKATRRKMRLKALGRRHSEATKRKLSVMFKGRTSPNKGKSPSAETRKKLSEATKGIKKGPFPESHKKNISLAKKKLAASKRAEGLAAGHSNGGAKGASNGRAILTDEQVRYIRCTCRIGTKRNPGNAKMLAAKFGITKTSVYNIYRRKSWTHVT